MVIQQEIVNWYLHHQRDLPWRHTSDAYVIWLSEVILQQTRVDQGLPYFERFLKEFPEVKDFAEASEEQILKLWQGLGYYSRGRNMLVTARQVMEQHGGVFPEAYESLIRLKGIGPYTAAAIASFSSNAAHAVLDGNVFRVLARCFGLSEPINSTSGQKLFAELANELLKGQEPSLYNQAIMEFGALQCKPHRPDCGICPIRLHCVAFSTGKVAELPVKLKKTKVRSRWFNYFVGVKEGAILIRQRGRGDVWEQLYDFPLIEYSGPITKEDPDFRKALSQLFGSSASITPLMNRKHLLSHQIIYVQFFALDNYIVNFNLHAEIKSVTIKDFKDLPHPKVIADFIETYL